MPRKLYKTKIPFTTEISNAFVGLGAMTAGKVYGFKFNLLGIKRFILSTYHIKESKHLEQLIKNEKNRRIAREFHREFKKASKMDVSRSMEISAQKILKQQQKSIARVIKLSSSYTSSYIYNELKTYRTIQTYIGTFFEEFVADYAHAFSKTLEEIYGIDKIQAEAVGKNAVNILSQYMVQNKNEILTLIKNNVGYLKDKYIFKQKDKEILTQTIRKALLRSFKPSIIKNLLNAQFIGEQKDLYSQASNIALNVSIKSSIDRINILTNAAIEYTNVLIKGSSKTIWGQKKLFQTILGDMFSYNMSRLKTNKFIRDIINEEPKKIKESIKPISKPIISKGFSEVFSTDLSNIFNKMNYKMVDITDGHFVPTGNSFNDKEIDNIVSYINEKIIAPLKKHAYYRAGSDRKKDINITSFSTGLKNLLTGINKFNKDIRENIGKNRGFNYISLVTESSSSGLRFLKMTLGIDKQHAVSVNIPIPVGLLVPSKASETPRKLMPIIVRDGNQLKAKSFFDLYYRNILSKLSRIEGRLAAMKRKTYTGKDTLQTIQRSLNLMLRTNIETFENMVGESMPSLKDSIGSFDPFIRTLINMPDVIKNDRDFWKILDEGRESINALFNIVNTKSSFRMLDIEGIPRATSLNLGTKALTNKYPFLPIQFSGISSTISDNGKFIINDIFDKYLDLTKFHGIKKRNIPRIISELIYGANIGGRERIEEIKRNVLKHGIAPSDNFFKTLYKNSTMTNSWSFNPRTFDTPAWRNLLKSGNVQFSYGFTKLNDIRSAMMLFYYSFPEYSVLNGKINPALTYLMFKGGTTVSDFADFMFESEEEKINTMSNILKRNLRNLSGEKAKIAKQLLDAINGKTKKSALHNSLYDSLLELAISEKFMGHFLEAKKTLGEDKVKEQLEQMYNALYSAKVGAIPQFNSTMLERILAAHNQYVGTTNQIFAINARMNAKINMLPQMVKKAFPFSVLSNTKALQKGISSDMLLTYFDPTRIQNIALRNKNKKEFMFSITDFATRMDRLGYQFSNYLSMFEPQKLNISKRKLADGATRKILARTLFTLGDLGEYGQISVSRTFANSFYYREVNPKVENFFTILSLNKLEEVSSDVSLIGKYIKENSIYSPNKTLTYAIKKALGSKFGKTNFKDLTENDFKKLLENRFIKELIGTHQTITLKQISGRPRRFTGLLKDINISVVKQQNSTEVPGKIIVKYSMEKTSPISIGDKLASLGLIKGVVGKIIGQQSFVKEAERMGVPVGKELIPLSIDLKGSLTPIYKKDLMGDMLYSISNDTVSTIIAALSFEKKNKSEILHKLANSHLINEKQLNKLINIFNTQRETQSLHKALYKILYGKNYEALNRTATKIEEVAKEKGSVDNILIDRMKKNIFKSWKSIRSVREALGQVWSLDEVNSLKHKKIKLSSGKDISVDKYILQMEKNLGILDESETTLVNTGKIMIDVATKQPDGTILNTVGFVGSSEVSLTNYANLVNKTYLFDTLYKSRSGVLLSLHREPLEGIISHIAGFDLAKRLRKDIRSYADITGEGKSLLDTVNLLMNRTNVSNAIVHNIEKKDIRTLTKFVINNAKRITELNSANQETNVASAIDLGSNSWVLPFSAFTPFRKHLEKGILNPVTTLMRMSDTWKDVDGTVITAARKGQFTPNVLKVDLLNIGDFNVIKEGKQFTYSSIKEKKEFLKELSSTLFGQNNQLTDYSFYVPSFFVGKYKYVQDNVDVVNIPTHTRTALSILEMLTRSVKNAASKEKIRKAFSSYEHQLLTSVGTKNGDIISAYKVHFRGEMGALVSDENLQALTAYINPNIFDKMVQDIYGKSGKFKSPEDVKSLMAFVLANPNVGGLMPVKVMRSKDRNLKAIVLDPATMTKVWRDLDQDIINLVPPSREKDFIKYREKILHSIYNMKQVLNKNIKEAKTLNTYKDIMTFFKNHGIDFDTLNFIVAKQNGILLPATGIRGDNKNKFIQLVNMEGATKITPFDVLNSKIVDNSIDNFVSQAKKSNLNTFWNDIAKSKSIGPLDTYLRRVVNRLIPIAYGLSANEKKAFKLSAQLVQKIQALKETDIIKKAVRTSSGGVMPMSIDYILRHMDRPNVQKVITNMADPSANKKKYFTKKEAEVLNFYFLHSKEIFGNLNLYPQFTEEINSLSMGHFPWQDEYNSALMTYADAYNLHEFHTVETGMYNTFVDNIKETLHVNDMTNSIRKSFEPYIKGFSDVLTPINKLYAQKLKNLKLNREDRIFQGLGNAFSKGTKKAMRRLEKISPTKALIAASTLIGSYFLLKLPRLDMQNSGEYYDYKGWGGDLSYRDNLSRSIETPFRKQKIRLMHMSPVLRANMINYMMQRELAKYSQGITNTNDFYNGEYNIPAKTKMINLW